MKYENPKMELIELVAREVFMVQSSPGGDNKGPFEETEEDF